MAESKPEKLWVGIILCLSKIGFKTLSTLGKLLKSSKLILGGATFLSFAWQYSWVFALVMLPALCLHEYGHLWAMRHTGMKTRGFYLIPFMGGAAVAEEDFKSREQESFTAIMGPVFGIFSIFIILLGYLATQSDKLLVMAIAVTGMNLFNLFPIHPLDGGRIFKSIVMSIHSKLGLVFLILGVIVAGVLAIKLKFGLYLFVLLLGAIELFFDYAKVRAAEVRGEADPKTRMNVKTLLASAGTYVFTLGTLLIILHYLAAMGKMTHEMQEVLRG